MKGEIIIKQIDSEVSLGYEISNQFLKEIIKFKELII